MKIMMTLEQKVDVLHSLLDHRGDVETVARIHSLPHMTVRRTWYRFRILGFSSILRKRLVQPKRKWDPDVLNWLLSERNLMKMAKLSLTERTVFLKREFPE